MTPRRLLKSDELLFLLLWCSGYIGAKLGVPIAGTFTLLLYHFIMVMLFVALIITVRREWRPPDRDMLLVGFCTFCLAYGDPESF